MKKRFFCILALLLALTLCSCDAPADEDNAIETATAPTVISENADGETVVLEYDLAVQMRLQSDFTLYLDSNRNLVSMEAGDEEGKNILSGLEFTGKPYDEGMGLVLNAALEQGYLVDQDEITFTVSSEEIFMSLMETLFAPVMAFEKDNGVFIFLDWDVLPEEEPNFEANSLYNLQKIEENDQTIYMDKSEWIHPASGGQTVYGYYSEFPNPMVYEYTPILIGGTLDTIRIKMLYFNEDGSSSVTYFEDGHTNKVVKINDRKYEIYEYENGEIAVLGNKNADGSYSFNEFHGINEENGNFIPSKSFGCWEDGTQNTSTYHSNGNVATQETYYPDGSFHQSTHDENGNMLHVVSKSADGSYSEAEFENGQEIYQKTVYPDGTYMEGRFENGNWTYTQGTIEHTDPEA